MSASLKPMPRRARSRSPRRSRRALIGKEEGRRPSKWSPRRRQGLRDHQDRVAVIKLTLLSHLLVGARFDCSEARMKYVQVFFWGFGRGHPDIRVLASTGASDGMDFAQSNRVHERAAVFVRRTAGCPRLVIARNLTPGEYPIRFMSSICLTRSHYGFAVGLAATFLSMQRRGKQRLPGKTLPRFLVPLTAICTKICLWNARGPMDQADICNAHVVSTSRGDAMRGNATQVSRALSP